MSYETDAYATVEATAARARWWSVGEGSTGLGRVLGGRRTRIGLLRWATVLALLVAYEIVARTLLANSGLVPPPSQILTTGLGVFAQEGVPTALETTAAEYGIAFGLAAVIGLGLGAVLGAIPSVRGVGRDVLQVLMALPQIAIYPIIILFFGIGPGAKIVFGTTHAVFPIVLGTISGVAQVEATLPQAVRAMGGGRLAVTWLAVFPSALPSVLTGLRIGAKMGLLGVLLAELLSSVNGTGALVATFSSAGQAPELYALTLGICVGAFVINTIMAVVERRLTRWRS